MTIKHQKPEWFDKWFKIQTINNKTGYENDINTGGYFYTKVKRNFDNFLGITF
jgi:hypothetical protein